MYQKMIFAMHMLAAKPAWEEWKFYDLSFFLMTVPMVFAYGIIIGSFLNVVIIRLPRGESLIKRASHCMTCGSKIRLIDLIPVFSWIFLRGKCHSCGEKISGRYPLVESLNGLLYVANFFVFGFHWNTVVMCLYTSVLVVVGFMDWDTLEIDLRVLAVILVLTIPSHFLNDISLIERLIGAACISLPFFLIGEISGLYYQKKTGEKIRGIELGDTLLMVCGGLFLGWKGVVPAAFIGILLAAVFGLVIKKVTGESKFAFGPYLCMGLLIGAMFGTQLTDWYISTLPQPETYSYYTSCILH